MISKRTAGVITNILPPPIVRRIAKFLINRYLSKYANITVVNGERLDHIKSPVIFICNHLSNSDGVVLNSILRNLDVTFIAGIKLTQNALTKIGLEVVKIIPINPNTADRSALSKSVKLLKSGKSICIFPEGTRSRTGSLIKGKKGVLLIAKLSGAPIIPVGIEGTEKLMPINDEDMGGEKFNYADVRVTIGEPFSLPSKNDGEDKEDYENRALHFTMKRIAELLPPKYQGIYRED